MTPEKAAKLSAAALMVAFKEMCPQDEAGQIDYTRGAQFRRGASDRAYYLSNCCLESIQKGTHWIQSMLGTYPVDASRVKVTDIIIALKDAGVKINEAHAAIQRDLLTLIKELNTFGTWEVLHAVRGVQPEEQPFQVGQCQFYRMDDRTFFRWGQRYTTGTYDPPQDAKVLQHWYQDEGILRGQVVAVATVLAADANHADGESRAAIEEALNLLRYGQLNFGRELQAAPEVGLTAIGPAGFVQQHGLCMRVDTRGHFSTNRSIAGNQGAIIGYCNMAPAWEPLEALLRVAVNERSELQRRIALSLAWVGQATLAAVRSVRVVALATALEVLLLQDHEGLGKKSKLAQRVSRFPQLPNARRHVDALAAEHLYEVRSGCLHAGQIEIPKADEDLATLAVGQCFSGLLTDARLGGCRTLAEVLGIWTGINRQESTVASC